MGQESLEKITVKIDVKIDVKNSLEGILRFDYNTPESPKATRQKRGPKDNERETHYRAHAMPRTPGGSFHLMEVKDG
jgi:hypothetical protein